LLSHEDLTPPAGDTRIYGAPRPSASSATIVPRWTRGHRAALGWVRRGPPACYPSVVAGRARRRRPTNSSRWRAAPACASCITAAAETARHRAATGI